MKRNYGLDLMRIFLSMCVIAVHSISFYGIENGYVSTAVSTFLLQADGAFFILSGYFNLGKEYTNSAEIKKYYKHKILYILFPYIAFIFVWELWDYVHICESFSIFELISNVYKAFMVDASYGHMWFMYPLFGLLLSAPFLSRLLHNLDDKELKMIWYITLVWDIYAYFLCMDLGMEFRFYNWFIDNWFMFFFAGYYYRRIISKESKIKWAVIGTFSFVLTFLGINFAKQFAGATNYQPLYLLFCVSCVMFWDKAINIQNDKICKVIKFISSNTFMVYLFHMRSMAIALSKLPITECNLGIGLLLLLITFTISLLAGFIANTLMKPIQKFLDRKWTVR